MPSNMFTNTVTTNGHARPLVALIDAPKAVRKSDDFDYLKDSGDTTDPRLFAYKGDWYDIGEFTPTATLKGWDAVQHHSHWSGVVIRVVADDDGYDYGAVVVGSLYIS